MEDLLFRLLALLERLGVWLSVLAWFTVAGGALAMAYTLRRERRAAVWRAAAGVGLLALAANLADYFATLHRSPDLSVEANPLWRNVVETFGLRVAKWYGFTGKIWVSILAAQMFAFYLANRAQLFPAQAATPLQFVRRLGQRAHSLRERLRNLFTVFAFFFAGINLLYFYVAFANWSDDPAIHTWLPPFPLVVFLLVVALAVAFAALTYHAFRRWQRG